MNHTERQTHTELFKYKDLKIYASTEWLAGNRKKYRQVFEQDELSYIYAELSIINKNYEKEPWDVAVVMKCFRLAKKKKEICSLELNRTISKHDYVSHIREGWGQKEKGVFWQKGKYCWEAFINGRKLATKYFYIEDLKEQSELEIHNTISVTNIEYFEGNYDQNNEGNTRTYYVEFPDFDTRYVFVELTIENHINQIEWFNEIFIRFYNSSRELKGEVVRLQKMKKGEDELQLTAGWGSNVKGSWRKGKYTVEIVYQDQLIAESSFLIGKEFREGDSILNLPETREAHSKSDASSPLTAIEAYQELNHLIGLRNIKKQISEHTRYIRFLQLRRERGFNESERMGLHSVFTGNPGTGKTTVARLLGAIYHSMGLLSKGHVHEVDRVDLVGEYIGQTAPKVKEAFEKAKGGVLFIDEAYSLARNNEDSKDFGREVIELLVKEMSHPDCNFMVVVAGYPSEMNSFINSNPGLSSRFKYYYDFEDFSLSELHQILDSFCSRYEVVLTDPAKSEIYGMIQDAYRTRTKTFGNARFVAQLLEKAKINLGIRLMNNSQPKELSDDKLRVIQLQDVHKIEVDKSSNAQNIEIDEKLLHEALKKLDSLIGLEDVKERIYQLIEIIRYRTFKGSTITGQLNMHTVLVGNPGTGKTTIARILAEIYKALGVLEKGHIIETDRQGLVAGYVGQTAIKTSNVIDSAMGGVLFIDEAYSLSKIGAFNDFGDEAIQVLLKKMEDHRGDFFTIVAGYPDEMERFLSANPGLRSRFDHHLHFPDFKKSELLEIAQSFASERGYRFSSNALSILKEQLGSEYDARNKHFGNARRVRQYVDEIVKQQSLRLGKEMSNSAGRYNVLIKSKDVENAIRMIEKSYKHQKGSIGFRREGNS